MSLTSFLNALFKRRSENAVDSAVPATKPHVSPTNSKAETVDNGVRMHIAAHDPAFPAKREAAVGIIVAGIDAVAQAHGFDKKAKSWAKSGDLGTVSIHLQRSRFGFDCQVNLGFQSLDSNTSGPWAQDDFVPLERFLLLDVAASEPLALLTYLDVYEDPTILAKSMRILSEDALPWLLAHLTDPNASTQPMPQRAAP
ncbi:DUF4304 domain-containing protein [Pseudorhodobacter wandonensis]|uniref:DUF4304 domain-containing protein n=1 Tax=Pseudorhodobacter wandonensis TaxID=1120568 RepID=UPI00067D3264|nr:DUF4304 domain-containing protein [Pseudorhodobacter wandonensis]